ncbi:tRNA (uracil(54)-C(5))-methyltransferase homolog [Hyalella azteca]|uniref:tRNA (uracil(54)-C(5))-methyltransferase n=1 Tax=Hyalella azteca TaxID=294128 RepID=A0A979FWB1_HYAAZ|nr:tRNA (uracil(54)-C(5))-methyltransferase homolog [Hyalella azteca]
MTMKRTIKSEDVTSLAVTTEGNQQEVVADVYTPLWRKPYAEQLQHKETSASLEDLLKIEDDLREYFCRGSGSATGLTSLYLHVSNTTHKCRHKDPYRLVFGAPHIEESCAHNKFRILPDTSFPFNREAEELVISAVQKTAGIDESTNLLHLGSGSGVQSLALARHVRRVVCLESSAAAVDDLEFNLQLNDITNVAVQDGPLHQPQDLPLRHKIAAS